jgi:hypothetical protein
MGWWPHYDASGVGATWKSPHVSVVIRFVEAIHALEKVKLYSYYDTECAQFRPSLLRRHGHSLKVLDAKLDFRDAWKPEHFEELRKAKVLEDLTVTIGLERLGAYPSSTSTHWPKEVQCILTSLTTLRHLTIKVSLQYDREDFVDIDRARRESAINDEYARKIVISLFTDFAPDTATETVRAVFYACEPGKVIWTSTVQRKWIPKEQRYGIEVDGDVEGEEYDRQCRSEPFDPFG